MQTDHYLALGITPDASDAEIRAAYLRIMREHHPDRRPGDREAEATARAANAAWEVLGDAARRGAYDRLRVDRPGGPTHAVKVVRSPEAEARAAAHRAQSAQFSRAFHMASVKAAVLVFALGLVLLLAVVR